MVNKRCRTLALLVLLVALALPVHTSAAARPAKQAQDVRRFGLVLDTGGRSDEGFNLLAYQGALIARTQYVVNLDYVVASASSTQVYRQDLERFARQGYDPVIGVGFPMNVAMFQAASAFPKTHFALVDAQPVNAAGAIVNLKNVASATRWPQNWSNPGGGRIGDL